MNLRFWQFMYVLSLRITYAARWVGVVLRTLIFVGQDGIEAGAQKLRTYSVTRVPKGCVEQLAYQHWASTSAPFMSRMQAYYDGEFRKSFTDMLTTATPDDSALLDGWRRNF